MQRPVKFQQHLSHISESMWQTIALTLYTLIVNFVLLSHPLDILFLLMHLSFFLFTHWVCVALLLPKPFISQLFDGANLSTEFIIQFYSFLEFAAFISDILIKMSMFHILLLFQLEDQLVIFVSVLYI